jgi:hypothetical protein
MSKRKHSELEDDIREDRANVVKATRLRHKFEHGTQLLFRALKTARGFERQKLGRRQKTAKNDGDTKGLERLNAEVQTLKVRYSPFARLRCSQLTHRSLQTLDLTVTAERHLLKQMVKTKRIVVSPEFARLRKSTSVSLSGPRDPAEANVTARLFKSNPVQNALPDIMSSIRNVLGLGDLPTKRLAAKATPTSAKGTVGTTEENTNQHQAVDQSDEENGGSKELLQKEESGDVEMNDAEDESDDFANFDARLASASDESDSDAEPGLDIARRPRSKQERYDAATDLSLLSESQAESAPESPPASTIKGRKQAALAGAPKDTTFLPSLMMGGYWSGSESGDGDGVDETEAAPRRKNRMGQQARRALWEKKFGSKANHLKSEQTRGKGSRDKGWDVRKGATEDRGAEPKWGKYQSGPSSRDRKQSQGSRRDDAADPSQREKAPSEQKPIHPSWEAARKAKEQKAQATFQGKKITFD